jgi:hypothetical protein
MKVRLIEVIRFELFAIIPISWQLPYYYLITITQLQTHWN